MFSLAGPRCPPDTPFGVQQKSLFSCTFPFHRSNWLKPCCGRRVALWQVCLLSAGFNCVLVACVILVVLFLSLELLIDTKLLQCKHPFVASDLQDEAKMNESDEYSHTRQHGIKYK